MYRGRGTSGGLEVATLSAILMYVENAYFRPVKERHIYIEVPFIYIICICRELFLASHPQANWLPLEDPLFARIGRFASDLFVRVYARLSVALLPRLHRPPPPPILTPSRRSELFIALSTYVRCVCANLFFFFLYIYTVSCVSRVNLDSTLWLRLVARFRSIPPPIPCCESRQHRVNKILYIM